MDIADLARVKKEWGRRRVLSLGICSRNVGADPNPLRGNVTTEMAKKEWGGARELGMPITLHTSGRAREAPRWAGLLGPDVQLVHPLNTTPEDRAILEGARYELFDVAGRRIATSRQRRRDSIGGADEGRRQDQDVDRSHDELQLRLLRLHAHAVCLHSHRVGTRIKLTTGGWSSSPPSTAPRPRHRRQGRLAVPGKRADMILVRTTDINMAPVGDP